MYLVEKGFANGAISASKGKVVEIKDKELASSLLEAGYIVPFSKKDMSNKEKDEEIKRLNSELEKKDAEIQSLNNTISTLETEKETLSTELEELKKLTGENPDNKLNSDEQKENLDNDGSTPNEDDENNGDEQKNQEPSIDGKDKNKKE